MNLFLFVFFLIYGTAHAYFLLSLGRAFPHLAGWWPCALGWCLLMVVAPLLTRLLEQKGWTPEATIVAYLGYCWMGLLFIFISLAVVFDLVRLLRWLAHFFVAVPGASCMTPQAFFTICFGAAFLVACYGWFEARNLKVERHTVATSKLAKGSPPIRVVQISDLHIGLIIGPRQVQQLVRAIRSEKPDLLVATGDIVDGHISHVDGVSEMFRSLSPPLGMVAVFGNHEYYAGQGMSRRFLEQSGFRVLQDQTLLLGNNLALVGVDDPAAIRIRGTQIADEAKQLSAVPGDRFVLLLKHRPEVGQGSAGHFDLQLSGHVHKGQIFPFNLLTWLRFPVRAGMNQLAGGGQLYVNRGAGTWGPPIRFLAPPELTVIDLVPAEK